MHEYDTVLKMLFQGSAGRALREIAGVAIQKWLNVEFPKMQNRRVDLMGETSEGGLVHLELQSRNEADMELRMAEYYLDTFRRLGKYPKQVLIYVGGEKLRMKGRLQSPAMSFHYRLLDIRDIDGEMLLRSSQPGDNILAMLTRLKSRSRAIPVIMAKIADLETAKRETAFRQLLLLCGLKGIEQQVEQEARKVPVLNDILDHKVIGREYKRGLHDGRQEGVQQGESTILRRQIQKRFGPLPAWADEQLAKSSTTELEELALRLLDAQTIERLFGVKS